MKNFALYFSILAILVFTCSILACANPKPRFEPGDLGTEAPDFTLKTINGETLKLSDFRGKPVILYFWSYEVITTCKLCPSFDQDLLLLQTVYDKWSNQGLVLLAVGILDDNIARAKRLAADKGLKFPILLDQKLEVYRGIYNIPSGAPITYFINSEGIIEATKFGYFDSVNEIENKLSSILINPQKVP